MEKQTDALLNPELYVMQKDLCRLLNFEISKLPYREERVIRLLFGLCNESRPHGMTLDAVAAKFDICRERVRQIKNRALRRLRHPSAAKILWEEIS